MKIGVIKQVAALQSMTAAELRNAWKTYFDTEPPLFNRTFLMNRLAYRIQDLALGGLSAQTEKKMMRMEVEEDAPPEKHKAPEGRFLAGTKLVREWKGTQHSCVVLADGGFEYQGRRFRSLSAVANAITGTKWNGLVFFNLKKQGEKA
ncbi:MAG: DUF2924 domain-containing protein [Magnetococcales bacterium]|nr:DUF2924 domain-containing protein [Magnetococcales bacterium]